MPRGEQRWRFEGTQGILPTIIVSRCEGNDWHVSTVMASIRAWARCGQQGSVRAPMEILWMYRSSGRQGWARKIRLENVTRLKHCVISWGSARPLKRDNIRHATSDRVPGYDQGPRREATLLTCLTDRCRKSAKLDGKRRCFYFFWHVVDKKVCNVSCIVSPINCCRLISSEEI